MSKGDPEGCIIAGNKFGACPVIGCSAMRTKGHSEILTFDAKNIVCEAAHQILTNVAPKERTGTPDGCIYYADKVGACPVEACGSEIARLRSGSGPAGRFRVNPKKIACDAAREHLKNIVAGRRTTKGRGGYWER